MDVKRIAPEHQSASKGFELDAQLTFLGERPRSEAEHAVRGWGELRREWYGDGDTVRALRLSGDVSRETILEQLRAGLEGGLLSRAELGLRGFLRSERSFEFMPWRRNVVVPKGELARVTLEEGVRYLIE
ncbi:hypothetical protein HNR42_000460 [Deinobacterium chartae]|uniref:Uncharacterized protein n=1 Tax=Deinobacterium chartae TaxID=521158 RepID=A0A841HVV4_9DEIO|nr:hypothetical protein [Deinobacterium chartae]MBB6097046.1 hypothetical protein [Deinobacterium chartae]